VEWVMVMGSVIFRLLSPLQRPCGAIREVTG
jgi:hypothetical protein